MEAHLTVEEGPALGTVLVVREGAAEVLGRGPGATLALKDPALAPRQLGLHLQGGALVAVDLATGARATLRAGELLRCGAHALRVDLIGGAPAQRRAQQVTARLEDPGVPRGEFELEGEIGRGASGKVYAARRLSDGRRVAIKVLADRLVVGSDEEARLAREGLAIERLKSPHVVELLERRVHDGRALLVLELVEGPSARDLVQAGPLPLARALSIALDAARGVATAARSGIVHRDIKPGNILVGPDGRARLCDFGVAKDLETRLTTLTRTGQGLGTMAYLPPEQIAQARDVDSRADVYALGATLFHLLAGRPPFEPRTPAALLALAEQPAPPLTGVPDDVAALVASMLAKDRAARPAPWSLPRALQALLDRHAKA